MTASRIRALVAIVAAVTTALVLVPARAGASPVRAASPARVRPQPDAPRYRPDHVLVKFKPGVAAHQRAQTLRGAQATTITPTTDIQSVSVPDGDVMGEVNRLKQDPTVEFAQPDYVYHASQSNPNDTYFAQQWGPTRVAAPESWDVARGSATDPPVVAVVDSGVDYLHPDLAPNMWSNPGGVGLCPAGTHGYNAISVNCTPLDDDGHGTHVAGIIGAVGNNGTGVAGVDWQARIMAVKFLDSHGNGDDMAAIRAIDWVVTAKTLGRVNVRVINASWGGADSDDALNTAIQNASAADILFVAAAGNAGLDVDGVPEYPCSTAGVLCVASSGLFDQRSVFSNYGASTVALAAPGECILSTVPTEFGFGENDPFCGTPAGGYAYLDGTSMATPFVSGTAALIAAAAPGQDATNLRDDIVDHVDTNPSLSGVVSSGGRLNVCKALAAAGVLTPPQVPRATQSGTAARVAWSAPCSGATDYSLTWTGGGSTTTVTPDKTVPVTGNTPYTFTITARRSGVPGPATTVRVTPLSGGYLLDGLGGLHPFAAPGGTAPPAANGAPYWRTWPIARGVALLPSGAGGYVLDGWGALHPFGVGAQPPPPPARTTATWRGWDIARGIALLPDGTGGYVLDGYGGLHPFAVGGNPMPPAPAGYPYWPSWDIARGVSLVPTGSLALTSAGGLVVDGWGGVHPFTVNGVGANLAPTGYAYWKGWDIARGITVSHDGTGGYVGDGWGALHPFALTQTPGALPAPAYWPGWDVARGPAL